MGGYFISQNLSYWLPWSFDVALSGAVFFGMGHLLKVHSEKVKKIYINGILLGCCFIGWIWLTLEFGSIELAVRSYPQGFTSYITAFLGTMIVLAVSYHCEQKVAPISRILIWFGENSFYVLMAHHVESSVIDYGQLWNNKILLFVVKLLIVFVLAIVIKFVVDKISGFVRTTNRRVING